MQKNSMLISKGAALLRCAHFAGGIQGRILSHFVKVLTFLLVLAFSTHTFAASQDTYKAKCAACHGATGAGDTMLGKNLKLRPLSSAEVQNQSDEQLFTIISKGKGKMPDFEKKLSQEQIRELVKHIRLLKK